MCRLSILKRFSTFWRSVRDFWKKGKAGVAVLLLSLFVLLYGYFIPYKHEVMVGWKAFESIQAIVDKLSPFAVVAGVIVGSIIGGIDFIMFLSDWYSERQEKRIAAAKAEGKAEGIAEGEAKGKAEGEAKGKAEGEAEGKAEERQLWIDWNTRRLEAEAKGEKFTEPPPSQQNN